MDSNEIQNEITAIIEDNRKAIGGRNARKQYAASKTQIATLTDLGIIDLMPNAPYSQHLGHSDAKAVIEAAQDSGKSVATDALSDDPSTYPASHLYTLLNEAGEDDDDEQQTVEHNCHTVYAEQRENGWITFLVLSNGFESEDQGYYDSAAEAMRAGRDWAEEDWSEYAN